MQDEIESVGRCRDLESLGYESKQSYYIKCPGCCVAEGFVPTGVTGEKVVTQKVKKVKTDEVAEKQSQVGAGTPPAIMGKETSPISSGRR